MSEISEFYANTKVQFLSQCFPTCFDYVQSPGGSFYWKKEKNALGISFNLSWEQEILLKYFDS